MYPHSHVLYYDKLTYCDLNQVECFYEGETILRILIFVSQNLCSDFFTSILSFWPVSSDIPLIGLLNCKHIPEKVQTEEKL